MEVRFLEGHLSWEGSSRKALRPGGEDLEIPFPHSTRSPQLGSEWSWLGNPAKTFRNPSEGLLDTYVQYIQYNTGLYKLCTGLTITTNNQFMDCSTGWYLESEF